MTVYTDSHWILADGSDRMETPATKMKKDKDNKYQKIKSSSAKVQSASKISAVSFDRTIAESLFALEKCTGEEKKTTRISVKRTTNENLTNKKQGEVHPKNQLNELTAKEWITETVSVWNQRGLGARHPDAQIERQHPAPFSFSDVGRLIRFFTKTGGIVLDPFVGIGSTLKACALLGRAGIGIELNPHFAELTRLRLKTEIHDMFSSVKEQQILEGDARALLPGMPEESVDLVVTSPPYWGILKKEDHKVRQERRANGLSTDYGDDPRDLANIRDYAGFVHELTEIFKECHRLLRTGKYMVIIVSDFREKSRYIMFHSDLARSLERIGLEMRGLTILHQKHKKVYPYGYPYSYVPNIHNQFILILQKPKATK